MLHGGRPPCAGCRQEAIDVENGAFYTRINPGFGGLILLGSVEPVIARFAAPLRKEKVRINARPSGATAAQPICNRQVGGSNPPFGSRAKLTVGS